MSLPAVRSSTRAGDDVARLGEWHALIVAHGKARCHARAPRCQGCPLLADVPDGSGVARGVAVCRTALRAPRGALRLTGMDLGIIGLPASGKTTLWRALTGGAPPGGGSGRLEASIGVVRVPDERVDRLATLYESKKVTHAEIRWFDYPVAAVASRGAETSMLGEMARMDALAPVVGAFGGDDGIAVRPARPRDAGAGTHLRRPRVDRAPARADRARDSLDAGRGPRVTGGRARSAGARHRAARGGRRAARAGADRGRAEGPRRLPVADAPATAGRGQCRGRRCRPRRGESRPSSRRTSTPPATTAVALCAQLEAEVAALDPGEAAEFRSELGLPPVSPVDRLVREAYALLGVHSFLTAGRPEARAWTLPVGGTALEAAGRIHSDIARGFIRAEVARFDELMAAGSLVELRKQGRLRTEGRDYVVEDGDVIEVLFNV